jgi:hypothetical protein
MYYDPHNDQFDRESDEDFIVHSSSGFNGVRRTVRRTDDRDNNRGNNRGNNRDNIHDNIRENVHDNSRREERKHERYRQRDERRKRVRERNRRRHDDSVDDPEDYVIEEYEDHEISEDSEDSLLNDTTSKKAVVRNHNFYSSRMNDDEGDLEDPIVDRPRSMSKPSITKYLGPLSSSRIIVEEEKESGLKSIGHYLSRNTDEYYNHENKLVSDGFHIDTKEAIKMQNEDKTSLDCGICKKKRGEHTLIGPFRYYIKDRVTDEMVYWFHRECLERNDIVTQVSKYEFENIQE